VTQRTQHLLQRASRRHLALQDPERFYEFYLSTPDKPKIPQFARAWLDFFLQPGLDHLVLMAPVGHTKTSTLALLLPCWWLTRDRRERILIGSRSSDRAQGEVRAVRRALEDPRLVADFGAFYSPELKWTDAQFEVLGRDSTLRTPSVLAAGRASNIEGERFTREVFDDIGDQDSELSEVERTRTWDWLLETAYGRLEPGARAYYIGTRWHMEDTYGKLMQRAGHRSVVFKAYLEDGSPLWPEVYTPTVLAARRTSMGERAFAQKFLNDPAAIEGEMFRRKWFERNYYDPAQLKLEELDIVAGVDPAIGEGVGSDYFAATVLGFDKPRQFCYHLETRADIWDLPRQFEELRLLNAKWRPRHIAIEDVQFQWQAYRPLAAELPIVPLRPTPGRDKYQRIGSVAPWVENGTVKWHPVHSGDLIYELLQLPKAAHDDRADSFEIAWRSDRQGASHHMGEVMGWL